MRRWPLVVPVAGVGVLAAGLVFRRGPVLAVLAVLCGVAIVGSVLAAVHHAEVVAHRVGEPLGTLVLALAVTVIEVGLIVSMMIASEGAVHLALFASFLFLALVP
jgi:Ca2+:H+ antiporter